MMATPGATILQRPTLIRGITQPGMGVHPTVIPTSQSFGIASMPGNMGSPSTFMHHPGIISSPSTAAPQMTSSDALAKGNNFFNSLLTKCAPKSKKTIQNLIQSLIDGKKSSIEFTSAIQKEMNSMPQTQLAPFLDLALPHIRQSLNAGHTKLPGIRPPNLQTVTSTIIATNEPTVIPTVVPSILPSTSAMSIGTTVPTVVTPSGPSAPASGPPPVKKKKTPLPPGQKSAYAIKKEAREARKRERELAAAMNSQNDKPEDRQDQEQKIDKPTPKPKADKAKRSDKQKKQEKQLESLSAALRDDDDVNDVAAMGGVNLAEESQKIMASGTELVGTQIRSCKDEPFFDTKTLSVKISRIVRKFDLPEPSNDVITLISHATQERLKDIVERLGVLAEHRSENLKLNPMYETSNDVKGQMKFLAELDRIEKRRYEEQERELLLRVAKSRSKVEDPEQQKLRQKAKDMQRAEQEEVRQREANQTALLAIGPRKKLKTASSVSSMSSFGQQDMFKVSELIEPVVDYRSETAVRRTKRVNVRDLQVLLELDRIHLDRLVKIAAQ